jgi:signal transduction histidine kinase
MTGARMSDQSSAAAIEDSLRLLVLRSTALLDTGPEESFDRFTRLASRLLHAPVSLVSLVDDSRQFFKSHHGLPEPWASRRETPLSHSFCQHVVERREPLVVTDARDHDLVCDNLAIRDLNVVAYLGIPLVSAEGQVLGSFCAIDDKPRQWTSEQVDIMKDLAAAVMTEVALRRLSGEFLSSFRALRELESQRDEMVQMLVHDLRNPLSSLLAGLDMMDIGKNLSEKQQRYLGRAREGGNSLLAMINEILLVSKGEAGKLELDQRPLSPAALINAAVEQLSHLATMAGIELTTDLPADLPAISGDGPRLERVLVNLLANALDHTPRSGRVTIVAARDDEADVVQVSVIDEGQGVPDGYQERIFEKFEQARVEPERRSRSSGLGLPFCKTVVEAHGGRIGVENRAGGGACFYFTLPFGLR